MTFQLRIIVMIGVFTFYYIMVRYIRKSKINDDFSFIWLLWGLGLVLLGCAPELFEIISKLLGFYGTINSIFFVMIAANYCILFYLYIKTAVIENKLKDLIQHNSINETKI